LVNLAIKPTLRVDELEVRYSDEKWRILRELRGRAADLTKTLESSMINTTIYGSIARGDVKPTSDIDVFVQSATPLQVELALERAGTPARRRLLVQATPSYAPKICWEVEDRVQVSAPLVRLQRNEVEFYAFGGQADYRQLLAGVRVPGVDKRLMLIEPTPSGHRESSVVGVESAVAKLLGVSPQTVQERVRVLRKRDRVGRTGIFVKRELDPDEAVGQVMAEEAARNPELRRRVSESTGL